MIQALGYLRAADDWYENGSYEQLKTEAAVDSWIATTKFTPNTCDSVF